jgi:Zn-dependent peptidase ImmA (M78 family)/transcriptional regulator with XRE-family HTH domain
MVDVISRRLKAARERSGMTQEELSKQFGFNDRQTVTAIETGQRKLSADELLKAVQIFGLDLSYFTDEFRADGEALFSWRASNDIDVQSLKTFEDGASRWVAAYKTIGDRLGVHSSPLEYVLPLTVKSSFEDAQNAAERLCFEWQLGSVPALKLEDAISTKLDALVLYVDTPHGISGAACRIKNQRTIFINRQESLGRRNFNMAHETFHILTWDSMPPGHTDLERFDESTKQIKRVEQLAQNFAGALLMPEAEIRQQWETYGDHKINVWLGKVANYFCVSEDALRWRTINLTWLTLEFKTAIKNYTVAFVSTLNQGRDVPRLFSEKFLERLGAGLRDGCLSVRRAAQILGLTIDELANLFNSYELAVPFDL